MEEIYSFGMWLRRRRKALDLTQAALAQRVGCAEVTIRKIEADVFRPSQEMAERIAMCLDLSSEERTTFLRVARAQVAVDHLSPFGGSPDAPSAFSLPLRRSNLPTQMTDFVGRASECAELSELIVAHRLVTVSGVGGSGKTRLVLEVSHALLDYFHDGVCLVELASIQDPDLVVQAAVQSLGIREESPDNLLKTLCTAVGDKHMLVILDNCEHLIASCAEMSLALLRQCSQIHLVATSREPLHLLGEHIYPIPPLAIPTIDAVQSVEGLQQIESVQLFCGRAHAVQPKFRLTATNAPIIAEICRCLDGLPLAIELAAAGMRRLPLQVLLGQLRQPLVALVEGPRNLPPRQQSLRTTIDWSYQLLSPDQQQLFARLGIFTGSWTIEAVDAICSMPGQSSSALINGLAALLDKHFVRQVNDVASEPRFTILETLRAYALEQLALKGEADELRWRYAVYYRDLVEQAAKDLVGPQNTSVVKLLSREYEHLRAILHWVFAETSHERTALALELCSVLWRFWWMRGYLSEGQRWLDLAIANIAAGPVSVQAEIWYGNGVLARLRGDFVQAAEYFTTSLHLWQDKHDHSGIARALNSLGVLSFNQGNYDQARTYFEDSLALFRVLTDNHFIALTLNNLGNIAYKQGNLEQAVQWYQEGLHLLKCDNANQLTVALIKVNLADIARLRKRYRQAIHLLNEGLAVYLELNDIESILFCITNLIELALDLQQGELVAQLFGAADALYERSGIARSPVLAQAFERHMVAACHLIGVPAFDRARGKGRTTALEPLMTTTIHTLMLEATQQGDNNV